LFCCAQWIQLVAIYLGGKVKTFVGLAALFGGDCFLLSGFPLADAVGIHCVNIASYASLTFCYFTAINLVLASLRIKILSGLLAARNEEI